MEEKKYALAMYDIRGKQEFIFRSNKLKEIVGGSDIIRDLFDDYLYPAAKEVKTDKENLGIFNYKADENRGSQFSVDGFEKNLEEGYIGEVVYDGGGNFILLFKNKDIFKDVTYRFTKKVMEEVGTLKVLATCIEIDNFDNFKDDRDKLYDDKHRINERTESIVSPWSALPVVMVDRRTSQPIVAREKVNGNLTELTKESKAKYKKYDEARDDFNNKENVDVLDRMVTKKGEESLLAVVYIDGNSMGAKVQSCLKDEETQKDLTKYEDCVRELRKFSVEIQKNYIDDRLKDIDDQLKARRLVLGAGDEINFICNARDAYKVAKIYLENLPKGCSSCAGIAIFHSHAPYADVYRIAEECCESGKTLMKKNELDGTSFIDFHYIQGSIGTSLEDIRESEGTKDLVNPWLVDSWNKINTGKYTTVYNVEALVRDLNIMGRSNVKGLLQAAKDGETSFKLEVKRIIAHMRDSDREKLSVFISDEEIEKHRSLTYNVVIVYDLWFSDYREDQTNE